MRQGWFSVTRSGAGMGGGYPGLIELGLDDLPAWLASYLRTYVERDVRLLRDVSDPHGFSRFFRLMAALGAPKVNASQLGREIGITPKTARAWLGTLLAS